MRRWVWVVVLIVLLPLAGCRGNAKPIGVELRDRSRFDSEWQRYLALEPHKALAVAGDPQGLYATGFSFGKASREQAEQEALAACDLRRSDRRIEPPCRLHAVGNEILAGEQGRPGY